MKNGWTGGQYSVYRVLFGAYLFAHFAQLVPWGAEIWSSAGALPDGADSPLLHVFPNVFFLIDAPWFVTGFLVAAAGAAVLLAIGLFDRVAAVFLWYVLAALFGRNPLVANPALPYVGWLLLAHALTPRAPYGSWAARGRSDPGGGWALPSLLFAGAWIAMSVGHGYSGLTKLAGPSWVDGSAFEALLDNPLARPTWLRSVFLGLPATVLRWATWSALGLELAFPLLALFRTMRPFAWIAAVGLHVALAVLVDCADLSFGMLVLLAFTFDPAWIAPRRGAATERLFYDGGCGLCHRAVRFALAEAPDDVRLVFAPLASEAFRVPAARLAELPDSLVYETSAGVLLFRTDAVIHLLDRLGGMWHVMALGLRCVPRRLRDRAYDAVAAVRHRLFARPENTCPLIPAHLQGRFAS